MAFISFYSAALNLWLPLLKCPELCKGLNCVIKTRPQQQQKNIPLELNGQPTVRHKPWRAGRKEDAQLYWVYSKHVNQVILCTCSNSAHATQKAAHKAQPDCRSELISLPGQNIWAQLLQSTRHIGQQHNTACSPGSPWSWEKSLLFSFHSSVMKEEYSQTSPSPRIMQNILLLIIRCKNPLFNVTIESDS